MKVIIGTRGSQLAMWQTNHVKNLLEQKHPEVCFEIQIIKTTGDIDQKTPLSQIGGVGLFTKQLEHALAEKQVDIAVHSLKDMPSQIEDRFELAAILPREKPYDVFLSEKYKIKDMEQGIVVGTGSLRRASQLKNRFPKVQIKELRGNVDTRLRKLHEGQYDAIILAYAGIKRLDLAQSIQEIIPTEIAVPAVAQGAIAVEIRNAEQELSKIIAAIDHRSTRLCVEAERRFLRIVEGGCKVPVGAHAVLNGEKLDMTGFVGNLDGTKSIRKEMSFDINDEKAGEELARTMLAMGAKEILQEIKDAGGER